MAPKIKSQSTPDIAQMSSAKDSDLQPPEILPEATTSFDDSAADYLSAGTSSSNGASVPTTPGAESEGDIYAKFDSEAFPPVDRLTMFDILENFALPQRLEKMQTALQGNAEKLRRQRAKLANRAVERKNDLVGEWRKRIPAPEEQLDKYRKRMGDSIEGVSKRWNDSKSVTLGEKVSFVTACLNIFISGYLIGAWPEYFHLWYTAQLVYFMPIRWYKYHAIGYHYFLADLCYFTNFLLMLSIWFFPQSKRLFISTYCLALGNNAVAIAMWRNSLVFHSLDKVTSLFIHIMPCATLHVLVHLIPEELQRSRFPAVHTIIYSPPTAPEHYSLKDMLIWATAPYAVWQLAYHFLITVRKRNKIAAGNPTSFTYLRKSYKNHPLGKFVLSFPDALQEPVFMGIQYSYAMLTMLPCPIWFWYRWAGAAFLLVVFGWASYNGATFYIDVFGRRMEKELNQLKREMAQMDKSPEMGGRDGLGGAPGVSSAAHTAGQAAGKSSALDLGPSAQQAQAGGSTQRKGEVDAEGKQQQGN